MRKTALDRPQRAGELVSGFGFALIQGRRIGGPCKAVDNSGNTLAVNLRRAPVGDDMVLPMAACNESHAEVRPKLSRFRVALS